MAGGGYRRVSKGVFFSRHDHILQSTALSRGGSYPAFRASVATLQAAAPVKDHYDDSSSNRFAPSSSNCEGRGRGRDRETPLTTLPQGVVNHRYV